MKFKWSNLTLVLLIASALLYTFVVTVEKRVEEMTTQNDICKIVIFYNGGYGFGYDFRARITSQGSPIATVYLGIYDLKHDVDLDRIKILEDAIEFDLYFGEKVTVGCDKIRVVN